MRACLESPVRNRISSLLHRWAYRIEGHRAEHRAGETLAGAVFTAVNASVRDELERRESRGWN